MRILIVTSCTGQKIVEDSRALTGEEFSRGSEFVQSREAVLADKLTPAQDLYSGQQHVRLMRGIREAVSESLFINLHIVSAGYGLVPGTRRLAPYECTFTGRGKVGLRAWAERLGIPTAFRSLMAAPHDLVLLLLGNDYLAACGIDGSLHLASPTIILCGRNTLRNLPKLAKIRPVALGNPEAKRFSCGFVALKGEIAARLLGHLARVPQSLPMLIHPDTRLLDLLDLRDSDREASKS